MRRGILIIDSRRLSDRIASAITQAVHLRLDLKDRLGRQQLLTLKRRHGRLKVGIARLKPLQHRADGRPAYHRNTHQPANSKNDLAAPVGRLQRQLIRKHRLVRAGLFQPRPG
jgi:hypothetical protein